MKRVLTISIILCVCLLLSACVKECVHEFESAITAEANCITEGVRTDTCQLCQYASTEPVPTTDHDWDDGTVTTPATCTAEGIRTYTCTVCAVTKTEPVELVPHAFDQGVEAQAATCAEEGIRTYTCETCGKTKSEPTETLEHTYGEAAVTKEPTCKDEGEMSITCTGCGHQEVTETIPKTNTHAYENQVIRKPTCISRGEGKNVCTICGHSVPCDYELAKHSYGKATVIREATCSQAGEQTFTCTVCSHVRTEQIPVKDHAWDGAPCNSPTTCTVCGHIDFNGRGHEYALDYQEGGGEYYIGRKVYKCIHCSSIKTDYFGPSGPYDFEAVKAAGIKRAKELGFGTGSVPSDAKSYKEVYESYYFMVESLGGQDVLVRGAISTVNRVYDKLLGDNQNPADYNIKITVSYTSSGALGTGTFYITVVTHRKS